jgi:hypothetical protein
LAPASNASIIGELRNLGLESGGASRWLLLLLFIDGVETKPLIASAVNMLVGDPNKCWSLLCPDLSRWQAAAAGSPVGSLGASSVSTP